MIGIGGHRLVEMHPPHGLNGRHDLRTTKTDCRGATERTAGNVETVHIREGCFERVKVVRWLPLLCHGERIHHDDGMSRKGTIMVFFLQRVLLWRRGELGAITPVAVMIRPRPATAA